MGALATMLRSTAPAALVSACALVTAGASSGAALPLIRGVLTLAGIPLALALAAWLVLHHRARRQAQARSDATWA